jgi:hypothetical protein
MTRRRETKPDPAIANPDAPTVREWLREQSADPLLLAVKESLGEPLTAEERARLEAARSAGPKPAGGGS